MSPQTGLIKESFNSEMDDLKNKATKYNAKFCDWPLRVARKLVSQNKNRFVEDGFDLDLSYLTKNIIVMGFPAAGFEACYRNPRNEILIFLDAYHGQEYYKVFNFCSEKDRQYSASDFNGNVEFYPFEDHNVPSLPSMIQFCESAKKWLDMNPNNVVALHCKAGKGRAGLMACVLLLRMAYFQTSSDAILHYNNTRVKDLQGLTVTSQRRWVSYYESILMKMKDGIEFRRSPSSSFIVKEIRFKNYFTGVELPNLLLNICTLSEKGKDLLVTVRNEEVLFLDVPIEASRFMKLWLDTEFIRPDQNGSVVFYRNDFDGVRRDKKYRKLPAAFELEFIVKRKL